VTSPSPSPDPFERAGQRITMDYPAEILALPDNNETVHGPVGQEPVPPE
jgi:hypothetical protein